MVPLATLIVLWLWSDGSIFFAKEEKTGLYKLNLRNPRVVFTCIVCLITGATGVYYAFFSCFFAMVTGFYKFFKEKAKYSLLSALIVVTVISTSVLLNAAPSLLYWHEHGSNPEIAARQPAEADIYGLKTVHLILPIPYHRIPLLRNLREKYTNANFPLETENAYGSLGIIGSLGFLGLLALLLFKPIGLNYYSKVLNHLAILNLSGILLANIGGFGSLFNLFVSPQIRAYNRISIFIAFFSLLAVALFIQKNIRQHRFLNKRAVSLLIVFILSIGIIDQIPPVIFEPSYKEIKAKFRNDRTFVKEIESQLPANSMVFQMPYVGFPEFPAPSPNQPDASAFFRGYLHSKNLKWSFGAMAGRNDNWHAWVSQQPLDELLTIIAAVGFKGIHMDRKNYLDTGKQIEAELKQHLGVEPIASLNGDFVFFNMEKFNATYRKKYSQQEIQAHREAALKPRIVKLDWEDGFYPFESDTSGDWHWASNTAIWKFTNSKNMSKEITINMLLKTGEAGQSKLILQGNLFNESLTISNEPIQFTKTFSVPPGEHTIKFESDAKQFLSGDTRSLFFAVVNFRLHENNGVDWQELSKSLADSMK
jgi:phosphoglycerol transferase